uniref:Acyl-[acyl-carrier-protein]--UDP-N-acetylglucosamine O-acyltransferase n=1 Tax=Candidatus Kentrum sp. MB TaxID=2138164 RepID=A0A450X3K2_9GAMM|nr:MAG: acyl-[acyl-carrier-protein]--UDP-N-acetylglucosamine O-acyltransferase [Candidatus Kentron sp. MB]VFK26739.1 MAG: acyl-[acyl-carrier-protein]--UDP-N-acetylglucosamine O-acyltransferase [Candidatus Kentron sp. MB]VFK74613.1 MAG: acyl-[acyl-carrier-protein]--UDP-N-acetylglucosamine O-acyltransferase [Candidatus Kentron sp. MB]
MIHDSATIDPTARLASNVRIDPWSIIGAGVEIGAGTWIGSHCVINGPTIIGKDNHIHPFNSIGNIPQDKKYSGDSDTFLTIGDKNVIREYCTLNRGTAQGGGATRVGNDNWIMAYVHIAHDCQIGNDIVMANGTTLAGHVSIEDYVTLGGFTLIHQFCTVGAYSFSGGGSAIARDVPPYLMVAGNHAKPYGINIVGLQRRGFDSETLQQLRRAYKSIYKRGNTLDKAMIELQDMATEENGINRIIDFLRKSSRGIVR